VGVKNHPEYSHQSPNELLAPEQSENDRVGNHEQENAQHHGRHIETVVYPFGAVNNQAQRRHRERANADAYEKELIRREKHVQQRGSETERHKHGRQYEAKQKARYQKESS
jgi:hypothetical protein